MGALLESAAATRVPLAPRAAVGAVVVNATLAGTWIGDRVACACACSEPGGQSAPEKLRCLRRLVATPRDEARVQPGAHGRAGEPRGAHRSAAAGESRRRGGAVRAARAGGPAGAAAGRAIGDGRRRCAVRRVHRCRTRARRWPLPVSRAPLRAAACQPATILALASATILALASHLDAAPAREVVASGGWHRGETDSCLPARSRSVPLCGAPGAMRPHASGVPLRRDAASRGHGRGSRDGDR